MVLPLPPAHIATGAIVDGLYSDMTNEHLRGELYGRGLPVSGNKSELIARLEADDASMAEQHEQMDEKLPPVASHKFSKDDYDFVGVSPEFCHRPASIHFSPNPSKGR